MFCCNTNPKKTKACGLGGRGARFYFSFFLFLSLCFMLWFLSKAFPEFCPFYNSDSSLLSLQEGADRVPHRECGQLQGAHYSHSVCGDYWLWLPGLPAESKGHQHRGEPVCQGLRSLNNLSMAFICILYIHMKEKKKQAEIWVFGVIMSEKE